MWLLLRHTNCRLLFYCSSYLSINHKLPQIHACQWQWYCVYCMHLSSIKKQVNLVQSETKMVCPELYICIRVCLGFIIAAVKFSVLKNWKDCCSPKHQAQIIKDDIYGSNNIFASFHISVYVCYFIRQSLPNQTGCSRSPKCHCLRHILVICAFPVHIYYTCSLNSLLPNHATKSLWHSHEGIWLSLIRI